MWQWHREVQISSRNRSWVLSSLWMTSQIACQHQLLLLWKPTRPLRWITTIQISMRVIFGDLNQPEVVIRRYGNWLVKTPLLNSDLLYCEIARVLTSSFAWSEAKRKPIILETDFGWCLIDQIIRCVSIVNLKRYSFSVVESMNLLHPWSNKWNAILDFTRKSLPFQLSSIWWLNLRNFETGTTWWTRNGDVNSAIDFHIWPPV